MAEVVVELGGKEILRLPLKGPKMIIGRDPTCDLHLDNRALSRRHAEIEKRGAAIWVRDLESQNGTFVNGERIAEPQALNGGDRIAVGRYELRIDGVEPADGLADETEPPLPVGLSPRELFAQARSRHAAGDVAGALHLGREAARRAPDELEIIDQVAAWEHARAASSRAR